MNASFLDILTSLSTFSAAIATVAAVICAWKQLKNTLPHLEEQRESMIAQQKIEIKNQEIAIRHQQNAVVMRLWENWDNALNFGSTRDDLLRFVSWVETANDKESFSAWICFFAQGHSFDSLAAKSMLANPPLEVCAKFDVGDDGLSIEDVVRVRGSLNRFLNMVEQAAVAYTEGFGNTEVMEKCMVPTLQRYSGLLLQYMDTVREKEIETWQPIYELKPTYAWRTTAKVSDDNKFLEATPIENGASATDSPKLPR